MASIAAALAAAEKKLAPSRKHSLDLPHSELKKELTPREASPLEVVGTRSVLSGKGPLPGKGVLQPVPSRALGTLRQDRAERRESLQKQEAIREVDSSEGDTDEEPENSQATQEPRLSPHSEASHNLSPKGSGEGREEDTFLHGDLKNQGPVLSGLLTGVMLGSPRIEVPGLSQKRLWRPQAFEEATNSLQAPSLTHKSGPISPTPSEGCWKAQHLHTQALAALCPGSSELTPTSCSAATSTSGKPGTWSWKFLIESPDRASTNKKITRTGEPANSQDLETTVPTLPKYLSPEEEKPQPPSVPGLIHPLVEVPSQNWLWEPECGQMEKEEPSLSITEVPDSSGHRRQDITCRAHPLSPETPPSQLWRSQELGGQQEHQDLALTSDELLKQT